MGRNNTELLIADIDPSTTQLISVTITCITERTISFVIILEKVCISESDAATLAQALVTEVETSLESSVDDGTFVESLQDNAVEIAASCSVDCEELNEDIESITNITNFGTPTVETQAFVFVSTVSEISILFLKCSIYVICSLTNSIFYPIPLFYTDFFNINYCLC